MSRETAIGIVGAGAWGTALAHILSTKGYTVTLWCREVEVAEQIRSHHENYVFLPGISLSDQLQVTGELSEACQNKDMILFVVPSQYTRTVLQEARDFFSKDSILICASKGIEIKTLKLISEVFKEEVPHHPACFISGPSFAREVARQEPTALALASVDAAALKKVQNNLSLPFFKLYSTHDVIGVEVGGAFKNVMAIASGIVTGLGLGDSTRAAMLTRGLNEMSRLGVKLGAEALTFAGLSGLGDLVLTCYGELSRNRSLGIELAKGRPLEEILGERKVVTEGVATAKAIHDLAQKLKLDLPISEEVYQILYHKKKPAAAIQSLSSRALRHERD